MEKEASVDAGRRVRSPREMLGIWTQVPGVGGNGEKWLECSII